MEKIEVGHVMTEPEVKDLKKEVLQESLFNINKKRRGLWTRG